MHALQVCALLQARGHRVRLACPGGSRLEAEARAHAVPALALHVSGYAHPVQLVRLAHHLRHDDVDVIHCHQSRDIAVAVPAMLLSGIRRPVILSKSVGSYIMKRDLLHRLTHAHISRVLAISSVIKRNVIATTPVAPERVITYPFFVNTERFARERANPAKLREEFGVPHGSILIGFVGRFSPGKGHEELLQASVILHQRHPHARVLVVGEASYGEEEYHREILAMASRVGLEDIVTFTGFRRDVPDVMAAFDVLAFPSHAEAFGMVLIEAMAMERPVVCTNCDGVLDIVVDGVTGLYVEPRNPQQLADALSLLIGDGDLREKMGREGRKRVLAHFDERASIDRLEAIYAEVRAESPARRPLEPAAGG